MSALNSLLNPAATARTTQATELKRCFEVLGIRPGRPGELPFTLDVTAGSETELQAAVIGGAESVDLPLSIRNSSFFANVVRRVGAGDTSRKAVSRLERYLEHNPTGVWENSWVRFPHHALNANARAVLDHDLRANKTNPDGPYRQDAYRFLVRQDGVEFVRVPVSYLVKLALADAVFDGGPPLAAVVRAALRLMPCFLNDNTSPETHSFHVVSLDPQTGYGLGLAKETAKRYLLTHLLTLYANEKFRLREHGQEAIIFFSPHPPVRQKQLNDSISDSFYRELFMSPCLSGWSDGEAKHAYMVLCHQVLSRSHLNAVGKLREAGIITRNLVVLPNTSNVGLANNGVHVTLGSRRLTQALHDPDSGFAAPDEKRVGDLVTKIVEHFLPLFVGTYSAAPYRLDFPDFHPERVLGFLSHELDYTHLRMLWRRWKGKAKTRRLGHAFTPLGPEVLDRILMVALRLRGDYVPDFRIIDYLVALMSTEQSPALDGTLESSERLKKDLDELGVFDRRMSLYLLYKLRQHSVMGFSGFEARHYSLFESLRLDMTQAVNLQALITALAFQYAVEGRYTHGDIPDQPLRESERRQAIFGAAIGLPTFYVHAKTDNLFLLSILKRTRGVRQSGRYPGYLRVQTADYQRALVDTITRDGAALIEMLGLRETLVELRVRLDPSRECSAFEKLTRGIMGARRGASPLNVRAQDFNLAAEDFYREQLRAKHLDEALDLLADDLCECAQALHEDSDARAALAETLGHESPLEFVSRVRKQLRAGDARSDTVRRLIHLMLTLEFVEGRSASTTVEEPRLEPTPVS